MRVLSCGLIKCSENIQSYSRGEVALKALIWKKPGMKKQLKIISILMVRFSMGVMWTLSGLTWIRRDATAHLETALTVALERGQTYGFYEPFLLEIVLPSKVLYAGLVTWGEFLTGISYLSGTLTRLSSMVALFLLINYSLMNGSLLSPFNLLFLGLNTLIFITRPGRTYGIDKLLRKKWPESWWV